MKLETTLIDKLESASTAFSNWKCVSREIKQTYIKNLGKLLRSNRERYAVMITTEMGKPITQSLAEIDKCAQLCDYYSTINYLPDVRPVDTELEYSSILVEPLGVILGVMPWNFPFWQVMRFVVPTILSGNTVLFKHASICSGSAAAIQELFLNASFPEGVVGYLIADHDQIEQIIKDPRVQGVSLTGSELAGRSIAQVAGRNLKRCVLELGGSDAFIVLDDADIPRAAEDAALARLQNCGQTCVAAKRIIVHKNIEEEFMVHFIDHYSRYLPEDPLDPRTKLSRMARADLADELEQQYQRALSYGAHVVKKLERVSDTEFVPGILAVSSDNRILDEEIFGPLVLVLFCEDDQSILETANATPFGLAAAIYTTSAKRIEWFTQELEVGSVAINQIFRSDVRFPFGGRKNSGYGTELSLYAMEEFTVKKAVMGKLRP